MERRLPCLLPTFRDPAGSLELRDDVAIRLVRPPFDQPLLEFLRTEQARSLVEEGRLVATEVTGTEPLTLRHPRVPFVTYPWEWPSGMWLAAGQLTLDLCLDLLKDGRILRDATPLNVLFQGVQPVLVDVLSVEPADPTQRTWRAYGQFVRTFALPLLARRELGWPLAATVMRRDGYEPEELWPHLSVAQRVQRATFSLVTAPTLLGRRRAAKAAAAGGAVSRTNDPELARYTVERAIRGLRAGYRAMAPKRRETRWSGYTAGCSHYSEADLAAKRRFVSEVVTRLRPARVLDVGCNTGEYSDVAAESGAGYVVGIEADEGALERMVDRVAKGRHARSITAVLANLARPTPATGWLNLESMSLLERCREAFDLVMMLAFVHHLLLAEQIPMEAIAALCSQMTRRDLLIEWVPATDPMFVALLRGREAMYGQLSEAGFLEEFGRFFTIAGSVRLENGRTIFHMQR